MVGYDAQMAFGLIVNKPIGYVSHGRVSEGSGISGAEGTEGLKIFMVVLFRSIRVLSFMMDR